MPLHSRRRRGVRRLALVLAGVCAWSAAMVASAAAHGDEGRMQLEATASGSMEAFVRATVIYANDSDVALGATVTVEAAGPDGGSVPPTPLVEVGDGRYETTLTFPAAGAWTLRATAAAPTATGETVFTAALGVTTTTVPDVELAEPRQVEAPDGGDADDSGFVTPVIAVAVIGLGAAIAAWVLQRRRRAA